MHHAPPTHHGRRFIRSASRLAGSIAIALASTTATAQSDCWPADFTCDGQVDGADLGKLLAVWSSTSSDYGDLDGNGIIDGGDLGLLLSQWGTLGPMPDAQLIATPREFLTNQDGQQVRYQLQVPPDMPGVTSIKLHQSDQTGNVNPTAFATATDDGDLENGDDIAFDGVYSAMVKYDADQPTSEHVVARISFQGGGQAESNSEHIQVVRRISEGEALVMSNVMAEAESIWKFHSDKAGNTLEARQLAAEEMAQISFVSDAGLTNSEQNIWMKLENGVQATILANPEGSRGSAGRKSRKSPPSFKQRPSRTLATLPTLPSDPVQFTLETAPTPQGGIAGFLPGEPEYVGSGRVLVWDAFNWQFAPWDEGPFIRNLYQQQQCPAFQVDYLVDAQTTVDSVLNFTDYDTIAMITHGAEDGEGLVTFATGELISPQGNLRHNLDLMLGHVSLMGRWYSIRPSKIAGLAGGFENAIIYNGSCESIRNNTLGNAFAAKGAKSYYGFSEIVESDFAQDCGERFFEEFIVNRDLNGTAFDDVDPKRDNRPWTWNPEFQEMGIRDLGYTSESQNLSFERGLESWSVDGDGRFLHYLAGFRPTEGKSMAIVSTGLGFTTSMGTVQQSFCPPADATHIEFDWNFFSEELEEWCGPEHPYDDAFRVDLVWNGGAQTIFSTEIDDLCEGLLLRSDAWFDQSGPNCVATPDAGYGTGGNDCKVFCTTWRHAVADISALANQLAGDSVTLRFHTTDSGDSVFDTAVLIDHVQIITD